MRKLKLHELNRPAIAEYRNIAKIPVTIILDNIRSALNVGAIFRTADAFAFEKILICGISATPPNREITKAAIGATESVDWQYFDDTKDAVWSLKNQNYKIIGVEQTDVSVEINQYAPTLDKTALIFGNEVDGISDDILEWVDDFIEIPQFGTKHSLNVSVCAGIVMWKFSDVFRGR